ncbi:hypothetical protein GCM10009416_11130 [Craurococcus roseus]|uniref:Acyl-CoA dehydrogenase/oxidase N-terminal domain-containing protein n=2 Tax=Craurococcus roseus TaxID=77585 RepID=A0ABP3PS88_9PROT
MLAGGTVGEETGAARHVGGGRAPNAFARAVAAPRTAAIDRDEAYPWDAVRALADAGFLGMTVPCGLGGRGRAAQVLRTLVASKVPGWRSPQGRDGYAGRGTGRAAGREAAE